MKNNKKFSYLFFVILILFLMFLYGFSHKRNSQKKVKAVVVEFSEGQNQFLTHADVDKLLIQNNVSVKNQPKSSINLYQLEKEVFKNPYVENADVYITPQGVLKTYIKQRDPIFRVVDKQAKFYVDKYGKIMPLSVNFSSRVPLVSDVYSIEDINNIKKLVLFINTDDFLKREITAIQKNKKQDFILLTRSGLYTINIGNVTNLANKFSKYKVFYNSIVPPNSSTNMSSYKEINVKFHNQVVCTKQYPNGK